MELFDFIRVMFSDQKKYQEIKTSIKGKHFFMTQRFFSIKYPSTAQQLNRNGINGSAVVDLWQIVASRFGKVPGWIYTKTKKSTKDSTWKPNPEISNLWMQKNEMSEKDLKMAIKLNPEEMKKSFQLLEKKMNMYE